MGKMLMPKAVAVWLIDNTSLTFAQIADFCQLHPLEVQGIADGGIASEILGQNPIEMGIITRKMLERAEKDPNVILKIDSDTEDFLEKQRKKRAKYTPIARRQDKPDAILYILNSYPEISDAKIIKLIGTTNKTIRAIRNREHRNMENLRPRDPVLLGLCTQGNFNIAVEEALARKQKMQETQGYIATEQATENQAMESLGTESSATESQIAGEHNQADANYDNSDSQGELDNQDAGDQIDVSDQIINNQDSAS
jgi:hypothetical protein